MCHIDRQLLFPIETTAVNKTISPACERVPTAWLRRTYLLLTPSLMEDRVRVTLSDTHERRLARQFKVDKLAPMLMEWLAVALSSFERSVAHLRAWLRDETKAHWIRVMFVHLADPLRERTLGWEAVCDYFRDYPLVPPPAFGVPSDYVLWTCAVWRCAVSVFIESLVPAKDPQQCLRESYQWRLYRGTHLSMFTACCSHRRYDDAWFLHTCPPVVPPEREPDPITTTTLPPTAAKPVLRKPWPWLALIYPSCHAVVCAGELPSLALTQSYTGHWFDMGNRKKHKMMPAAITQTFELKCEGRSCLGRNAPEMQGRTFTHFPITFELFALIVQCVMLGHFPSPVEPMSLLTLVRINASFGRFASAAAHERMRTFTCQMRILPRLYLGLFHYAYTLPQCPALWEFHQSLGRATRYVSILHESDSVWRRAINKQVTGLSSHVDWAALETPGDGAGDSGVGSTGRMAQMHGHALPFNTKIKKGRFEEVLRRKLTAIENELGDDMDVDGHVKKMLDKDRMEWILFVAWVSARRSHSAYSPVHTHTMIPTEYLRALGMTKRGAVSVRRKEVQYWAYDQHDDSLRVWGKELYAACPLDYHIIKTTMVAYETFRNQRPFLLSLREKRLTAWALRTAMSIEPNAAPPPLTGVSHYCEGCRHCGNDVAEVSGIVRNDMELIRRVIKSNSNPNAKRTPWTPATLAFGFNARDADVAGFYKVYYNPAKGNLFCRRRRGEPFKEGEDGGPTAAAPALDGDEADGGGAGDEAPQTHREALFETLAADRATLTTRSLINAFGDFNEDAMPAVPDTVETTPVDAAAAAADKEAPGKRRRPLQQERDLVTRRALGATLFNCTKPMVELDLVGVMFKAGNTVHTRCVVCGRHAVAHSAHQTNAGMTCARHVNVAETPDYHRLWWSLNISRNEAERQLKATCDPAVPCYVCLTRLDTTKQLRVYDFCWRLFTVALCTHHLAQCANLLPVAFKNARLPMVRIDHLNAAARGFHKKMHM